MMKIKQDKINLFRRVIRYDASEDIVEKTVSTFRDMAISAIANGQVKLHRSIPGALYDDEEEMVFESVIIHPDLFDKFIDEVRQLENGVDILNRYLA